MDRKKVCRGRALSIAIGITMLVLLLAGGAGAATITVDDSGGADYTRIQDAIDNASAGDTILVQSGTYYENVNVNKQLTLRGIDKPVVDARLTGSVIVLTSNHIILEGFTATRSGPYPETGIRINSNYNTLSGNNASNNNFWGIHVYSNNNIIENNNFSYNNYGGLLLGDSDNNIIRNNIISHNNGTGISFAFSDINKGDNYNTIIDNIIENNKFSGISLSGYSGNNNFTNNTVNYNDLSGFYSNPGNNNFTNNTVNYNGQYGFFLYNNANFLANNIVKENNISDIYIYIDTYMYISDELCNNIIENTTGSGDRPIKYFNTSINLQNEVLSQLILCNADNSNINNVTIEGSATQRNNYGLEVIGTDNSNFSNINSSNNYYGIFLTYSNSNNLANNTVNSNSGIGINLYNSSSNILNNNTADSNSRPGIYLTDSNSNYLTNNTANSNIQTGIYLSNSNSNNLTNNTAKYDISIGISIVNSDNNILTNNIGNSNGRFGFNIRSSNDNTLINNIADSNIGNGIRLNYSNMNIIIGNIANLNNESGINITSSNGNVIYNNYLNNFFNYHFDMISRNTWNTNQTRGIKIIGGNFWASPNGTGFSQTCEDADRDGICDSAYVLDANNTDYLPLALITYPVHNINKGTHYLTIQSAIDDANIGDEIHVDSGTYYENVNVTKQLTLKGVDTGGGIPVVDAGGSMSAITLAADGIILEGFTATGAAGYLNAGIKVTSNNNTLSGNNASLNNNYGIFLDSSSNNTISGNLALSNNETGIYLASSSNNIVRLSTSDLNNVNGITLFLNSNYNLLEENNVSGNVRGISLLSSSDHNMLINNTANSNNNIVRNDISTINNHTGFNINSSNNTLRGNIAEFNDRYGIRTSSNNTIYNNYLNNIFNYYFDMISRNTWNTTKTPGTNIIGGPYLGGNFWASPDGIGFSQTCTDADRDGICDSPFVLDANNTDYLPLSMNFTSLGRAHNINKGTHYSAIQAAIDDANPGDEIHVDSGTYYENVNVTKQLILKGNDTGSGNPVVDANRNGEAIILIADGIRLEGFAAINSSLLFRNNGIRVISNNNLLSNITASNNRNGILVNGVNNTLSNNIASNNSVSGIILAGKGNNNNIIRNNIYNNNFGLEVNSSSNNNIIYDNILKNTYNLKIHINFSSNKWNTTKTSGTNIIGGPYVSGNFWASTNDTGFSQTCTDADRDGICDLPYVLDANNTDYLPLAAPDAPSIPSEIHGQVFNDINGNGIIDAGEAGILGVEIHLTRMISPGIEFLAGIISTDLNGNYSLTGISSGYYRIEEFPDSSVQTYPANGMPQFLTLGVGEIKNEVNFGNQIILPGKIHGNIFNDSNGNGMQDTGESGTSGVNICLYPSSRCNTTDSSGNYSFLDVSPGTYNIYEYLPSGFVATTPMIVTIAVNSGEVIAINFGNRLPVSPPADISVSQQSGEQNGVPTVFRPSLTVLTISKNLTNISENVISVNLTMNWSDGTTRTDNMVEIGSTNVWMADFSTPFPGGTAQMRFEADVYPAGPGPEDAIQIGDIIFIDPSGQIKDACTGNSISDATVTLLVEYPLGTGNFIDSPPENQIPEDNPLITGDDGRYSWLTIPGTYKVRADKAGYEIAQSDSVTVPPPVTDLNISMIPIGGCVPSDITAPDSVTNLNNITYASTYINWTWTDPDNVDFARVKVYLDGIYKDDVLKGVHYYNATVEPGTHTIGTRTVDTSGNINSTMKTHTATTILPSVRYINGTVMDSITKEVLSGVKLSTTGASTTSNISGFYSLPVASGTYPITATYDIRYYTNNSVTVSTESSAVVVQDIELVKKPTGNITGSVTKT